MDVSTTRTGIVGFPCKNRGVSFEGNTSSKMGYIKIDGLTFAPSFSVHTWALLKGTGKKQTIFSKDRFDSTGILTDQASLSAYITD